MSDQTRRIFIDSRHKLPSSTSNGEFQVSLPWAVHVPAGTQLFIDNLVLSNTWPTVSAANCNVFVKETVGGNAYHRLLALAHGAYNIGTLAAELQAKLRSGSYITDGLYTVTHASNRLQVVNSTSTAGSTTYIYSRDDILSKNEFTVNWTLNGVNYTVTNDFQVIWQAATVVSPGGPPPSPAADANELLGLMHEGAHIYTGSVTRFAHVDLQRHKALYLCSSDLGESTTLDLVGNTNIIRKVNVGATVQGDVVIDTLQSNVCFSVYRADAVLKHLSFAIRDFDGNIVSFYDHQVSFEVVLVRPSDR
jgi:hypothetical protein